MSHPVLSTQVTHQATYGAYRLTQVQKFACTALYPYQDHSGRFRMYEPLLIFVLLIRMYVA